MKARQLSPKAATLVAAFDRAAYELASKRKTPNYPQALIDAAEVKHQKAFEALRKYITRLERFREVAIQKGVSQWEKK